MESIQTKYGKKIPWIMGNKVRIPRVNYPVYRESTMSLPSPGRSLMLIIIYGVLFFLVAGGIYISIENPIAIGGDNKGNAVFIYPSTSSAFIIESIVAALVIYLAGLGFFLIYQSTKHAYNYSYAIKIMIFGILLAFAGFVFLQWMIDQKIS